MRTHCQLSGPAALQALLSEGCSEAYLVRGLAAFFLAALYDWLVFDFKGFQPLMQEKAKEIYMTFLSSKASSQVNVEGQSRLNETILETPHPLMFQKLQDQIFNLMKYDSYSRFLKSDIFLNHKKPEEQEENSPEAQTAAKRASRIYNT
ncbi:regulator of G-protein signaling 10 isoform X3 [Anser cygnoides]|uniref:regulator of G-protein signaling 10 isoform X3 n=1 Tax=Anser cygnoides TaxID=8845 RepID=UPI002009D63E|nr:regulator of G-protein signaling 10 isoform X3 [Anser cygnoides]